MRLAEPRPQKTVCLQPRGGEYHGVPPPLNRHLSEHLSEPLSWAAHKPEHLVLTLWRLQSPQPRFRQPAW